MKSAAASSNKAGASSFPSPSSLSQIPLPRRKNSQKSDKGVDVDDTDSEYGHDAQAPRIQPKMSLLDSTSFCCTSGQKEDYIPDAKIVPVSRPPKKRPPNVSQKKDDLDPSTPKSPLLAAGISFLARSKKGKPSQDCPEDMSVQNGDSILVRDETSKVRPTNPFSEIRLRFGDDRRKITPPSPQRRLQKDPGTPRKDLPGQRKFADGLPKFPRDSNPGPPHMLKDSNDSASHNYSDNHNSGPGRKFDLTPTTGMKGLDVKSTLGCDQASNQSHDHDDFDCPCCDKTSVMMDEAGLSDIEVKTFGGCNAIIAAAVKPMGNRNIFAESGLQIEVKALKEELEAGKLKLQTQQDLVHHLEEELSVMNQIRNELDKEKELRKIAEDKLLELLDYEKELEILKRENEKKMETKSTQMDLCEPTNDCFVPEKGSPLLYEGRIRKYQSYIAKLEKDNLTLVNELKKLKDMSPRSQEEQAKVLVDKLDEMERNNQQQQLQYETCLDEVANKLVQTLLAQKRLEEECKILHLRVEQLEQENGTLMELMEDDKDEKVEKEISAKNTNAQLNSNIKQRKPSYHQLASSPVKKSPASHKPSITFEQRTKESTKSTKTKPASKTASSEPHTPVTSPVSPPLKPGCISKIPSFHNSKPVIVRKKSETSTSSSKPKHDVAFREDPEPLPACKSKLPSSAKCSKGTSAKRKRLSRNSSPADKGGKDSKQRIKSNHVRWDPRKDDDDNDDAPPPYQSLDCMREISPIQTYSQPQQVWSFNCEVNSNLPVPEIRQKIADSIEAFSDKLGFSCEHPDGKPDSSTPESSTIMEGANRTRDEGYSTMSSDLQQDSTADSTLSEQDNSATYVITEKVSYFPSDESVTECLDGSMCSSSDSGFGPLHHVVALRYSEELPIDADACRKELPKFDISNRKQGTVKSKDQIASVKPTVRPTNVNQSQSVHSDNKSNTTCDNFLCDSSTSISDKLTSLKPGDFKLLSPSKSKKNVDQSTMIDHWSFPKEVSDLSDFRKTWHLGPAKSKFDDQIMFCTRHSYIEDSPFDEKVETAEKATLTEPEEELWREKALAPFIDESIWSLYSSEGDMQVKHFPLEPLLSEPSLEKLISNCSPCIVITENVNPNGGVEFDKPVIRSANDSSIGDFQFIEQSGEMCRPVLERVASDTVLYLKDAIHELEDSMRRGLKSSKNISALHQDSASESETSPIRELGFKPEIMQTLQATMNKQTNLAWPSPSRSSSLSSLQSCASCHGVSDDMDDVDNARSSRKGSRDPDLSSASDAEYENLDHKDFVEQWLQKEITNSNVTRMAHNLEPVLEIGDCSPSYIRRSSLPCDSALKDGPVHPRLRFNSYPADGSLPIFPEQGYTYVTPSSPPFSNVKAYHTKDDDSSPEIVLNIDAMEDGDFQCLDPEAKEFNGDFYTLCSIGSLKSLDRFSPSRKCDITIKQLLESPIFNRKLQPKSCTVNSDKPKPTGLVKPTRPVSLAVSSAPKVPEHSNNNSQSPLKNYEFLKPSEVFKNVSKVPCSTAFDSVVINPNRSKVPLVNQTVFRKVDEPGSTPSRIKSPNQKLPLNSLPSSVKTKSPTKIIFRSAKCEDASKRQWKRDRNASRPNRLKEGCGTAWIHLHPNPSLSDPSIRNSLLESLKAPTSSSGSSDSSAGEEDDHVLVIQTNSHLHQICKEKRHKVKASANNPLYDLRKRTTIMGRRELFYRFGDKEKEAIACFDFLERIASSSIETLTKRVGTSDEPSPIPPSNLDLSNSKSSNKEGVHLLSPHLGDSHLMTDPAKSPFPSYSSRQLRLPNLWNKPLSHNMSTSTLNSSQDCELLDHLSLSDSCAESYSSTPESFDDVS